MRIPTTWRPGRTLAEEFSPRANSIGFLRLVLATSVLVGHAAPLGYGGVDYGFHLTRGQVGLGGIGVYGFFVLSGFLITASGTRFSLPRYGWHRFLRIFPGFWVCLVVTAFVIAPLAALYERDTLAGFWNHPRSPVDYVLANVATGMRQYTISGLVIDMPEGPGGAQAFNNGSLWTLVYELTCYVLVGALAWTGVLRHAPRLVALITAGLFLVVAADFARQLPAVRTWVFPRGHVGPFPLIGSLAVQTMLILFLMFLIGACAHLYRDRVPMHPGLAAGAAVVLVGSGWFGGFVLIGLPAYAYLLLWVACRLGGPVQRIGRARDYSYGIYIYAYPVQQVVAMLGGAAWGAPAYVALSLAGTMVLAVPSWHLVEKPAMALKNWTPRLPARWRPAPAATGAGPQAREPAPGHAVPRPRAGEPGPVAVAPQRGPVAPAPEAEPESVPGPTPEHAGPQRPQASSRS